MEFNVTFIIQLVAFLFTVALVSNVAFGPILHTLEERTKRIDGARAEAARMAGSAGNQAELIQKRIAAARTAGQEDIAKFKGDAEKAESESLAKVRADAGKQVEAARSSLKAATVKATEELAQQAQTLADAIAAKALGRKA